MTAHHPALSHLLMFSTVLPLILARPRSMDIALVGWEREGLVLLLIPCWCGGVRGPAGYQLLLPLPSLSECQSVWVLSSHQPPPLVSLSLSHHTGLTLPSLPLSHTLLLSSQSEFLDCSF